MLSSAVTSATVFVGENEEILREHYDEVVKGISNLTPLYLPESKQEKKECVDVGQNIFS